MIPWLFIHAFGHIKYNLWSLCGSIERWEFSFFKGLNAPEVKFSTVACPCPPVSASHVSLPLAIDLSCR